ncbi:glycosyltransferase family 2 protein [Methanospirillum sp.]
MEDIKVTVITITLNCEDTIAKTIDSVLSQTHQNIEYIIIDGSSTDNTRHVIQRIIDDRVYFASEDDKGIYDAMNKGFALASGDIIYFLNSGDYLYNISILETIVSYFKLNGDIDIIYGDIIAYGDNCQHLIKQKRYTPFHVMTRCSICHQALFVKRSSFFNSNPFNTNYRVYADYDWLLDGLSNYNYKIKYLDMPIVFYQEGGFSQRNRGKYSIERIRIINKYWFKVFSKFILLKYPKECIYFIIIYGYLIFFFSVYSMSLIKTKIIFYMNERK